MIPIQDRACNKKNIKSYYTEQKAQRRTADCRTETFCPGRTAGAAALNTGIIQVLLFLFS
jgi:hypothetical protein